MSDYFDSHVHLDFPGFDGERLSVIERARAAGIRRMLVPGCFPEQWNRLAELCEQGWGMDPTQPQIMIRVGVGLHPYWSGEESLWENEGALERLLADMAHAVQRMSAVCVGEIGLDQNKGAALPLQIKLFEVQLALARELSLPVVLHQVGCRQEFLACLKRVGMSDARGVVHGFSGDLGWARALTQRGLLLGVGAGIVHLARDRLRQTVAQLQLGDLLIETDAPDGRFRAGVTSQGKPLVHSEPSDLRLVVRSLAVLLACTEEQIALTTSASASRLLRF